MGNETKSIIDYLSENNRDLSEYFIECNSESKLPNYSEFCRKFLNGETKEGVSFTSIKVKRRVVTDYIRTEYRLWLTLN